MRNKNLTFEEIKDKVVDICKDEGVESLILFGSYSKGNFSPTSDIDFAISGNNYNFINILERVDNIKTLKKIDIVELDKCKNKSLMEDILEYGRKIY